jgi:hypothetical protein
MNEEQEARKCSAYQGQGKQGLAAQPQQQSELPSAVEQEQND